MTERIYVFYSPILEGSFDEIRAKLKSIEEAALNSYMNKTKNYKRLWVEKDPEDPTRLYVVGELNETVNK